ncbi:MAG TPA: hypothetical protein DCL08_02720 [Anaerolineaceae bacterium]|nr:hypothetical protein [Anaerolineaceae bacterium]
MDEEPLSIKRFAYQIPLVIQAVRMTNPPLFDNQDAFGCRWVVMEYFYGACDGGIPRVLILHVSNPVGGLSESDFFALILQFEIDEMCP